MISGVRRWGVQVPAPLLTLRMTLNKLFSVSGLRLLHQQIDGNCGGRLFPLPTQHPFPCFCFSLFAFAFRFGRTTSLPLWAMIPFPGSMTAACDPGSSHPTTETSSWWSCGPSRSNAVSFRAPARTTSFPEPCSFEGLTGPLPQSHCAPKWDWSFENGAGSEE